MIGQDTSKVWLTALVLLCAVALNLGLAVMHADRLTGSGPVLDGVPAVGNNDGYFHLDRAAEIAAQGRPVSDVLTDRRPSMLLPYLLAAVAGQDAALRHHIAAYAGPALGLSMALAVLPWALSGRSRFVILAAPLLALAAPYWLARTHVGFLDTDALVPMLCSLALFSLWRVVVAKQRVLWGAAYCALTVLSWHWWRPGAFLGVAFVAVYVLHPSRARTDGLLKSAILLAVAVGMALVLAGVRPFSLYWAYVIKHLALVFGGDGGGLLAKAIRELRGVTLAQLGQKSLGNSWLLVPIVPGLIGWWVRHRWQTLFLLPMLGFGVASLFSQRFIPLFIPAAALLAAQGLAEVSAWLGKVIPLQRDRARIAALGLSAVLLLGVGANTVLTFEPKSSFSRSDFELAEKVRAAFPADTVLWTWWDYGYFFEYLTGMKPLFDGGSQTLTTCFTAAWPLMQPDQDRAARWMHHFAVIKPRFDPTRQGAGWGTYVDGLEAAFPLVADGPPVALVIPAQTYASTGFLYAFAHAFDATVPPVVNRLEFFGKEGFSYDAAAATVTVPQAMVERGYDSVGAVLDGTGRTPEEYDLAALPDPYLVFSADTDFLAVTDRPVVRSVLFRLLGLFEYDRARFAPLYFDVRTGGVWRVN